GRALRDRRPPPAVGRHAGVRPDPALIGHRPGVSALLATGYVENPRNLRKAIRGVSRAGPLLASIALVGAWLFALGRLGGTVPVFASQAAPPDADHRPAYQFETQKIVSSGPLTRVEISNDLSCAIDHAGDVQPEFYGDRGCGTLVAVGGTLYRANDLASADLASPFTPLTPVSQTPVTGSGSATDPYRIVTVVDVGATDL